MTIIPGMDGFLWAANCTGTRNAGGKNCPLDDQGSGVACPNTSSTTIPWDQKGTIRDMAIPVKGTAGTKYTINFEVRGVVGGRCYTGGMMRSTAAPNATGANDGWYVGGVQAGDSIWNTYEIDVESPPVNGKDMCQEPASTTSSTMAACDKYFLNAFPMNPNWCQQEATYEISYMASFQVMGNSTLHFTIHDTNCQAQMNCGPNTSATTCDPTAIRTIDLSGLTPPPPSTFHQPYSQVTGTNTYYPQWMYFVVHSVTSP
jgi:hypothetical protein